MSSPCSLTISSEYIPGGLQIIKFANKSQQLVKVKNNKSSQSDLVTNIPIAFYTYIALEPYFFFIKPQKGGVCICPVSPEPKFVPGPEKMPSKVLTKRKKKCACDWSCTVKLVTKTTS